MSKDLEEGRPEARRWMITHVDEFVDPQTGEVNLTHLAEGAAFEADHDEWLDDPDHWVFLDAYNVDIWYLRNHGTPEWETGDYIDWDGGPEVTWSSMRTTSDLPGERKQPCPQMTR